MIIVTTGSAYVDIDAYGGCIAYANLLNLEGTPAEAVSSAPLNESITPSIRRLGTGLVAYTPRDDNEFVLVDVSVKKYFDPIVDIARVVEVIDHHWTDEETYWIDRLGSKAQIEVVGAACTQIFERWDKAGKLGAMSPDIATILAAGILDNTLNFNAGVTGERDHKAYDTLSDIAGLTKDFPAGYFSECQQTIEADLETAIRNDTKQMEPTAYLPQTFGQIVIWDADAILRDKKADILEITGSIGQDWITNLISISNGKSYFLATNPSSQAKFSELFGVKFENDISEPVPMMLRKEILKAAIDKQAN